jgi:geranylgeranyl pyrophosphate synthase
MHKMLNNYLARFKKLKFNGQDLAIVIGDVMYATAIHAFLSIREDMGNKERALKKFIEAAVYTGSGEFIELLCGTKAIERVTKEDVYKIYDYKTAYYTFSWPKRSSGAFPLRNTVRQGLPDKRRHTGHVQRRR